MNPPLIVPDVSLMPFRIWLMLDFDGVVHSNVPLASRPPQERKKWCYVARLESVLRRHPHVGIVITSSHRLDTSLRTMRSRFSPDIRSRIVGMTPKLAETGQGSRQLEVEAWLKASQSSLPWLALDDIVDLYRTGACVVEARDGFRNQEAADLEHALQDPIRWAKAHPVPPTWMPRTLWVPGA